MIEKPLKTLRNGNHSQPVASIWALKDVSFEVHRGEVVGIVGRNRSGKSTLLKTLSRITDPTLGSIELSGRCGSLLEVGTGFHPELTGRENVYLNGAILGMSRTEIKQRFDEIVAFAEVEQFIDTPVKHYSTGMYLRLAFAVAAHLRTEILFIDEVLAVGDIEFQRRCLGRVESIAREGRTVMLVSHNLGAVTQLCRRALWLNEGRLGARVNSASVRLRQQSEVTAVVSFDREFTAEIEYELRKPVADVSIVLRIVSESGTIIFTSSDSDTHDELRGSIRADGRYSSVCKIPGKLLKSGNFFLTVGLRRQGTWIESHENLLMFEVSAIGNPLHPQRLGVITPVLDWDVRKLD